MTARAGASDTASQAGGSAGQDAFTHPAKTFLPHSPSTSRPEIRRTILEQPLQGSWKGVPQYDTLILVFPLTGVTLAI